VTGPRRWLVDASNVVGARPDGWWRDRPAAVRRLHDALRRFADERGEAVVLVLDAPVSGLPADPAGRLAVVAAPHARTDAADDELVAQLAREPDVARVVVVTSDARLATRARRLGAQVEGAGAFRRRLDA
jgi:uncharacterized protein YaiI (UPF0178 family)